MLIIPVLDLRHGRIVHARRGERARYRPLHTPLSPSSEPANVLDAFLALYPFPVIYLADLDAIVDGRPQLAAVEALCTRARDVEFWVDAGISTAAQWRAWQHIRGLRPVIGSETLDSIAAAETVLGALFPYSPVLSLDFGRDGLLGPSLLASRQQSWPERVIAMCLDRVGSQTGPDISRLARLRQRAPGHVLFGSGGIRHAADLEALHAAGASGALVASALHDGSITGPDIERLSALPPGIPSAKAKV